MKFDWKYWIPLFITWTLLLVLIGCCFRLISHCSWIIENEKKKLQVPFLINYKASGPESDSGKEPTGEKTSDKDNED